MKEVMKNYEKNLKLKKRFKRNFLGMLCFCRLSANASNLTFSTDFLKNGRNKDNLPYVEKFQKNKISKGKCENVVNSS